MDYKIDYNQIYETNNKIPGYESSVEKPVFNQGFQPVVLEGGRCRNDDPVPIYYSDTEVLSFRECLFMLFVQFLPVVGIVMDFVWAFDKNSEMSPKKVLARSLLVFTGIAAVAGCIIAAVSGFSFWG